RAGSDIDWREYEPAIRRWEHILGRPAPTPHEPGQRGNPRLNPWFVEWLMGLPEGHVCGVPGIKRRDKLRALGNGVVPQHAELALRLMLADQEVAAGCPPKCPSPCSPRCSPSRCTPSARSP